MADTPAQAALRAAFSSKLSVIAQTLSAEQQQQARTNIGAISSTDLTNALTPYLTTANAQATYLGINATAQSANQWATARTISLSGDATGSVSINGAADATLPLTIANGAVTFSMVNSGDVATQAEAEAGTANNSFMTPLRVAQAIAALGSAGEAYITQTYHSGSTWYRVWSDGFIEQAGTGNAGSSVSLPKAFTTTSYFVDCMSTNASNIEGTELNLSSRNTSSFLVYCAFGGTNNFGGQNFLWFACGY